MTNIRIIGGASFDTTSVGSTELFGTLLRRSLASVLENDCLALLPGVSP